MTLEQEIKEATREIQDFPKQGIYYKDLTPILKNTVLSKKIANSLIEKSANLKPDAIACLEGRGFWYGMMIAQALNIPFIPIRKVGKLPYETLSYSYSLEYGAATMEVHSDAFKKGWRVLIHDDLLATGGTATAAAELVKMQGAQIAGFVFVVDLSFLGGKDKISKYSSDIISLATY
jgi:adenine phosphoribosyltransferase